jgi:hypothetical protein
MTTRGAADVLRWTTARTRDGVEWGWTLLLVAYAAALVLWPALWAARALPADYVGLLLTTFVPASWYLLLVHLALKLAERGLGVPARPAGP